MSSIQSVRRAFQILQVVARFPGSVQFRDVAERTNLPRSTVSRMLATLEELDLVQRAQPKGSYRLGPAVADLIAQPSWLRHLAEPWLKRLVADSSETATLSVMDGDRLFYITQHGDPSSTIQLRDWSGTHFPHLHVSSPCKLFLAHNRALRKRYLAQPLKAFTPNSIVDRHELNRQLELVCVQGYARALEEYERGLAGVSAPIFDRNQNLIAAISLSGPTFRVPSAESDTTFTNLVIQAAAEISAKLSGS